MMNFKILVRVRNIAKENNFVYKVIKSWGECIMRITQEADYALRVVLFLANLGYGEKIDAKTISEREVIPLRFLLKLLRKLTNSGILISYRGVNGGYSLNREPKYITLKDVVEAIDGPIYVNRCLYDKEFCTAKRNGRCPVHNALSKVQQSINKELEKINFESLVNGENY